MTETLKNFMDELVERLQSPDVVRQWYDEDRYTAYTFIGAAIGHMLDNGVQPSDGFLDALLDLHGPECLPVEWSEHALKWSVANKKWSSVIKQYRNENIPEDVREKALLSIPQEYMMEKFVKNFDPSWHWAELRDYIRGTNNDEMMVAVIEHWPIDYLRRIPEDFLSVAVARGSNYAMFLQSLISEEPFKGVVDDKIRGKSEEFLERSPYLLHTADDRELASKIFRCMDGMGLLSEILEKDPMAGFRALLADSSKDHPCVWRHFSAYKSIILNKPLDSDLIVLAGYYLNCLIRAGEDPEFVEQVKDRVYSIENTRGLKRGINRFKELVDVKEPA